MAGAVAGGVVEVFFFGDEEALGAFLFFGEEAIERIKGFDGLIAKGVNGGFLEKRGGVGRMADVGVMKLGDGSKGICVLAEASF